MAFQALKRFVITNMAFNFSKLVEQSADDLNDVRKLGNSRERKRCKIGAI